MFERFTDGARQALALAETEARTELHHDTVGTEHLLLGLLHAESEPPTPAAQALNDGGVTLDEARDAVVRLRGMGDAEPSGQIPFTPDAKRALERSLREALRLEHNFIGTEHLLLGVLREDDVVQVIADVGAEPEDIRARVLELRAAQPERRRGRRPNLGADAQAVLSRARDLATEDGAEEVSAEHLRKALEAP